MKEEVGGYARAYSVILIGCALAVFILYFSTVLATQTILGTSSPGTGFFGNVSLLEDRNMILNISINNTNYNQTAGGPITNVTIELPSGLVYTTGTQNVSSNFNNTFSNTTTVLNWSNESFFLINGSVDGSGTFGYFWFNVSATNPGQYNVVVRTFNTTGQANYGNITVNVNDTTNGTGFNVAPTNGTGFHLYQWNYTGTTSSTINLSGNFSDNFNLSSVVLFVWNSSSTVFPNDTINPRNTTATNGTNSLGNFTITFPREDRYVFNFRTNDTANNTAFNDTGNFTIVYDITRPLAEYNTTAGSSEANYANVSRNWTFVNATVTETFEANVTFTLYNITTLINETTFTTSQRTINWTNLLDGIYNYNITVIDIANNRNTTTTRNITIDTTRPLVAFNETGGTAVQNSNVSRNWTFVNVTVTETNEKNITFGLYYTNGTVVNVTNFTSGVRTINWTNLADGRYFYNVSIADYVDYQNTTTSRNITIDTTRPLIVFNDSTGGPTAAHYTNTTRTWVFVNVTASDTNEANITFTLYNSSGSVNVTTFANSSVRTINWTGLSDGNYTYNATITDYANTRNTTTTRTIFIDTTGPTVSIAKTSSTKTSLTLTITATDAVSGVNTPCTANRGGASVSGSTVTESSLACSTSYAYDITCNDFAGNSKVGSLSATTDSCSGGESGSSGGGGGGGGSTTTASAWTSTFVPEAAAVAQGYTREMSANERVKVTVSGQDHHVGIASVSASSVTVEIASTPQNVTLVVGETKKVDVTNDTTYDLSVTLNSISSGKANLTITSISEAMPGSPATSTGAATQEQPSTTSTAETEKAGAAAGTTGGASGKAGKTTAWIVVIVIVVVIGVIWFMKRKR